MKDYFDRSLDGGITWVLEDIVVSDQPGGWNFDIPGIYRCNGMPITVADLTDGSAGHDLRQLERSAQRRG